MRSSYVAALAVLSGVIAQVTPAPPPGATNGTTSIGPLEIAQSALGLLSPQCQATVKGLFNASSPIVQCLQLPALLPAIMTNMSVVPFVDSYLSTLCAAAPCSTAALNMTAAMIVSGCATDLASVKVSNQTVYDAIELYPLAREIACLKTTNATAPMNASIPINSTAYNHTNGTFCVTEVMSDLSGWLGSNLTNSYIDTLALGGNTTAIQIIEKIPKTAICNDCVFAAIDLVQAEYPKLAMANVSMNFTLDGYLNATCPAFNATTNGSVPNTVVEAALNSTFPLNVTSGNATYTPNSDAVPAPTFNLSNYKNIVGSATTMAANATSTP